MQFPQEAGRVLAEGGIVVASSARAARDLRRRFGSLERGRGLGAWIAPRILDWDRWLGEMWQERVRTGRETRILLLPQQEHRIWSRLSAPSIDGLISPEGVADLAQSAYALLSAYNAGGFLAGTSFENPDVEHFRDWARAFERECSRNGWVSRSRLAGELERAPSLALPPRILLVGFDRLAPADRRLLAACERSGSTVAHRQPLEGPAIEAFVRARDPQEELELCAQWVWRMLRRFHEKESARAAVILPDQTASRSAIERVFRQVLALNHTSLSPGVEPPPFEFSLGVPLLQMPLARAALLLLRWTESGLAQEDITWLVLSGFLWSRESDLLPLAEFDAAKRREGFLPLEQGLDSYLSRGNWNKSPNCLDLNRRLRMARRVRREGGGDSRRYDEWADLASRILEAAGWPGPRKLASEEFQVRARWMRMLDTISTLSFDGSTVPYSEFLSTVSREAAQTIFSPESRGAPVQVLGPHEAAGMEFDFLWFLGADDVNWPHRADPHPFLPRRLQIAHEMPHAESWRDWEMAKLVAERLQAGTGRMVVSYAAQAADGLRRPSTVFSIDPAQFLPPSALLARLGIEEPQKKTSPRLIEAAEPAFGPPWPSEQPAGGVNVLKAQAACPFQAFATHRLGAGRPDSPDWGLNPMDRGNLLHSALAAFWSEVKDSAALHSADSDGSLAETIARATGAALDPYRKKVGADGWSRAYLDAEEERLSGLIEEWLRIELRRSAFTVEKTEERMEGEVAGLKLGMRADRIDRVAAGRLILDYKSGLVGNPGWEERRPDEPQLPLYAACGGIEDLQGVFLAQIRAGAVAIPRGCVADPDATLYPGALANQPPYSGDRQERWRAVLSELARQYLAGSAAIDPKQYPKTCEYCALPSLCRIAEQGREQSGHGEGNGHQPGSGDAADD